MDNQVDDSDKTSNVNPGADRKTRRPLAAETERPVFTPFSSLANRSEFHDWEASSKTCKTESKAEDRFDGYVLPSLSSPAAATAAAGSSSDHPVVTFGWKKKAELRRCSELDVDSEDTDSSGSLRVVGEDSVKCPPSCSATKRRAIADTADKNQFTGFEPSRCQRTHLEFDYFPPAPSFRFTFSPVVSSATNQHASCSASNSAILLAPSAVVDLKAVENKRRFPDAADQRSQFPPTGWQFPVDCSFWKKRAKFDFRDNPPTPTVAIDLSVSNVVTSRASLLTSHRSSADGLQGETARPLGSAFIPSLPTTFVDNSKFLAIFGKESLVMSNQPASPGGQLVQDSSAENSCDPSESSSIFFMTSSDTESEEIEVTRLQALLEARGTPAQFLGAFGSRMHQLSERAASTAATGKQIQEIMQRLESSKDEGDLLASLIDLCQLLVMGNEETLAGFPIRQAVPVLMRLLRMEHNFDIMHQSCRALTYLMEGLPRSSPTVAEAVPLLLEKLHSIECMDVAEQSLRALEILSRKHGKSILQRNGVAAVLKYIDFFSITAQRSALAITANCCLNMTIDEFCYIQDSLPLITSRLTNQDKRLVESACVCLARLVDNYQSEERLLKEIAVHGLLTDIQQLLFVTPSIISTQTLVTVLHMLVVMCYNCPDLAIILLKLNVAETLSYLLIGTSDKGRTSGSPELVPRSPQELFEIVSLIGELMPLLPNDRLFAIDALFGSNNIGLAKQSGIWQWKDDNDVWRSYNATDNRIIEMAHQSGEQDVSLTSMGRAYIVDFNIMQQINEDTGTSRQVQRKVNAINSKPETAAVKSDSRADVLYENSELANGLTTTLFAVLFEVYNSCAAMFVRHKCLRTILRILFYGESDILANVLQAVPVSSHSAAMLSSNDLQIVVSAIQMCNILMSKLPDVFSIYFRRQGVLYQMNKLVQLTVLDLSMKKKASPLSAPPTTTVSPNVFPSVGAAGSSSGSTADKSPKETAKASSPGPQLRLSDVLKRKKPIRKTSKKPGKGEDDAADPVPSSSSSSSSQSSSSSRFGAGTSHGRLFGAKDSKVGILTPKTFLASLNPTRWGRSSQPVSERPLVARKSSLTKTTADLSQPTVDNRDVIKQWISDQASKFIDKYFDGDVEGLSHPSLAIFNHLCSSVGFTGQDLNLDAKYLQTVADILSRSDVSPFEVIHSGLIKKLLLFFTSLSPEYVAIEDRLTTFVKIFIGQPSSDGVSDRSRWILLTPPPLLPLVNKLMACFHHLEQFQVKVHDLREMNSGRGVHVMQFFHSQHIKCNLQPHPDCTSMKAARSASISVDPFTRIHAIERYITNRRIVKVCKTTLEDSDDEEDVTEGDDDDDEDDDDDVEDEAEDREIDNSVSNSLPSSEHEKPVLELCIGDHLLPFHMTIYQAVKRFSRTSEGNDADVDTAPRPIEENAIWKQTHLIWYRPVTVTTVDKQDDQSASEPQKSDRSAHLPSSKPADNLNMNRLHLLKSYLTSVATGNMAIEEDPALEVLALLQILHRLNSDWTAVFSMDYCNAVVAIGRQEFISNKLMAKATRQLQDPATATTGRLPQWLMQLADSCPFLLPFEIRHLLFCATSLDRDRALLRMQELTREPTAIEGSDRQVGSRLERKKKIISRDDLLKQAEAAINDLKGSRAVLEIQYENEVGSGLGPTLEFYALVSQEFQRADLDLWRGEKRHKITGNGEDLQYVYSPCGLFPVPLPKNVKSHHLRRIKSKFSFLGKFMARALLDSRILDLPLSSLFYKCLVNKESALCMSDLQFLDPDLYSSISKLLRLLTEKQHIENDECKPQELRVSLLENLTLDGCHVQDLELDYTLPGYPNIELKKGGKDISVTLDNLDEYIQLVLRWSLVYGVQHQFEAVREGFRSTMSLNSLNLFFVEEMDQLFCGSQQEIWSIKYLTEVCLTDHGYTHDSQAVKYLFSILSSYSHEEQRLFLQFVTGSPRLPVGGLKSLNPPLTIVRKTDAREYADDFLPSVMTCVNYLKLPDYSSVEVMRDKMAVAICEGQLSFHLS